MVIKLFYSFLYMNARFLAIVYSYISERTVAHHTFNTYSHALTLLVLQNVCDYDVLCHIVIHYNSPFLYLVDGNYVIYNLYHFLVIIINKTMLEYIENM